MDEKHNREGGFTLVEVLASIIILSIASLTMTAFFNNAMSYNKGNQNKTVLINIARNTLVYMEKQDFVKFKEYFVGKVDANGNEIISPVSRIESVNCTSEVCDPKLVEIFGSSFPTFLEVLHPVVNNIQYEVTIRYQEAIVQSNNDTIAPDPDNDIDKKLLNDYLLPILISVSNQENVENRRYKISEVEGYITREDIR